MKILVVCQHYWPENFRITDIAEELVKRGHSVTVLCGLPNYPKGYIFDGYKDKKNWVQEHNGVKIIRVKEIERRNNIIFRLLNYWSYPHYACKKIKDLDKNFDVILVNELSPIMMCKPAIKYKKKYGTRIVMYEMDLWPESLLAGGIKKESLPYNYYKKVSANIYSKADKILVSSEPHIDYIHALKNCESVDISFLPQYAESLFEAEIEPVKHDGINLVFAGNIGKAQSVDTIVRAAALLDDTFKFTIVGDGSELDNVKQLASELKVTNVEFTGRLPLEEMPNMYANADAMLVTLEDSSYTRMTLPGKVQSYMAMGKPIISAASGYTNEFINKANCGISSDSRDFQALSNMIKELTSNQLSLYAENSIKYYQEHLLRKIFIDKLIDEIADLCK